MRKIITALLLFALSFLSCAPKNRSAGFSDCDPRFAGQLIDAAESADAYYWHPIIHGVYYYYYDKKTGTGGILCNKPDCTHGDLESCSGSAQSAACPSLTIIDGRLCWVAIREKPDGSCVYSLYSMNTDSADRRVLFDLNLPEDTAPQSIIIHRGNTFIYSLADRVENGVPRSVTKFLSVPLDGGKTTEIARYDTPQAEAPRVKVRAVGERVYYLLSRIDENGGTNNEIFRYDIVSERYESVYSDNAGPIRDLYADGDGSLYVCYAEKSKSPACVCRIENGLAEKLFDFSGEDRSSRSVRFSDGVAIGESYEDGELMPTLWVRKLDGTTVFYGMLPDTISNSISGTIVDINAIAICGNEKGLLISFEPIIADAEVKEWPAFFLRCEFTDNGLVETLLCSASAIAMGG